MMVTNNLYYNIDKLHVIYWVLYCNIRPVYLLNNDWLQSLLYMLNMCTISFFYLVFSIDFT